MASDIPVQGAFVHGADADEERLRLHVVLAQVYPNSSEHGVVDEALPKLAHLAQQAAASGADVIVFPEYFLTGATHGAWHSVKRVPALQGHDIAPWVKDVADISAAHDIAIVTGSVVQLRAFADGDTTQHGLYNTTYFLDRKGTVCGIYTKRNLWHAERAILASATDKTHPIEDQAASFVFETRRGLVVRSAMVMCWDLMFPEAFRRMIGPKKEGASDAHLDRPGQWVGPDVIFAPTCWYADDSGPAALAWNADCEEACLSTYPYPLTRRAHRVPCDGERELCVHVQCGRPAQDERRAAPWPRPVELQRAPAWVQRTRRARARDAPVPHARHARAHDRARRLPHPLRPARRPAEPPIATW